MQPTLHIKHEVEPDQVPVMLINLSDNDMLLEKHE